MMSILKKAVDGSVDLELAYHAPGETPKATDDAWGSGEIRADFWKRHEFEELLSAI